MRVHEDTSSFGRCDLKRRVAEPFDQDRSRTVGRNPQDTSLNHFELMAEAQSAAREDCKGSQQKEKSSR